MFVAAAMVGKNMIDHGKSA